jgi:hypothetical protein
MVTSSTNEVVDDLAAKMNIAPDILAGAALTACLLVAHEDGLVGAALLEMLRQLTRVDHDDSADTNDFSSEVRC